MTKATKAKASNAKKAAKKVKTVKTTTKTFELKSIYRPRTVEDDNRRPKEKSLKWADEHGAKCCIIKEYEIPPPDKSNWWQRDSPVEITAAWSATLEPGKGITVFLTSALQQSLAITQMSAAYPTSSKAKNPSAKIVLSYCDTDSPTSETPRHQILIGHIAASKSRKTKTRIPSGTFHIINKGSVTASLHGLIESLYFKMV
eukprot:TRINITY_DN12903_c0_g1_i1.p1 TRINITY_DN12903_c0_g1~~TRINITY_DN12903_c0_g1_i1.p1  ORF type:complete len:232 (+),score=37.93 TRINITY_DN12903_c0_g1_i1:96-698(+)